MSKILTITRQALGVVFITSGILSLTVNLEPVSPAQLTLVLLGALTLIVLGVIFLIPTYKHWELEFNKEQQKEQQEKAELTELEITQNKLSEAKTSVDCLSELALEQHNELVYLREQVEMYQEAIHGATMRNRLQASANKGMVEALRNREGNIVKN